MAGTGLGSYVWARPSLHAKKLRDLELRPATRQPAARKGRLTPTTSRPSAKRSGAGSSKRRRAYARFVTGWNPRGPKKVRTGAATEVRR